MKPSRYFSLKRARDLIWIVGILVPLTASGAVNTATPAPIISEQQAIGLALNRIEAGKQAITVSNPRHRAVFDRKGVQFTPRRGPAWHWQLSRINNARQAAVPPIHSASGVVDYARNSLIERYLVKANTIEQRFVLERPWPKGQDLVITGAIKSKGKLEATDHGWVWRDDTGVVTLGQVTVFDATGRILPAQMQVTDTHSTIQVAATDLAGAVYPVTIDPEIGANDFRISDMGTDGDPAFDATNPAVTYNAMRNEYLVVWRGDNDTGALEDGEFEIFGQRIDADTGAEVGTNDFRISDMGTTDGDTRFGATSPAVAWNATHNEYLVVWQGDDDTGTLVDDEFEIFGQRINAEGVEVGTDFRISDMGPDGLINYSAFAPAVAWNAADNEYLVVWQGDDDTAPLVDNEVEIFGQRIDAAGVEVGTDFRISDMGTTDGDTRFGATSPAVAWNATNNEYLVVWQGDDDTNLLVDDEIEIFGQRINAAGVEFGTDFRISDMGTMDGDASFSATSPAVAWNATDNEYLVVWQGDDNTPPLVNNEFEIFGQRIDAATGTELGADFRISDMGPPGNTSYDATSPAVTWNLAANEYLAVWRGDDDTGLLVDNEFEIFGRRLDAAGNEIGTSHIQFSDMGIAGDINFAAFSPAVAYNITTNEFLVVWSGDDDTGPLVNDEDEIFGQLFSAIAAGGGGGGCALNPATTGHDPVFPLLILVALGYLSRRRLHREAA
jgi:hypothetical protein